MLLPRLVVASLAVSWAPACAQDSGEPTAQARDLLVHADSPLFTAASVRMAGTRVTESTVPAGSTETAFTQTLSRSGRGRVEEGAANTYRLDIFDGTTLSSYSAATNSYSQTAVRGAPATMLSLMNLLRFGSDSWNIASAAMVRQESIDFGGTDTPCDVVRAAYNGAPGNANARNVVRTVWIARANSIIVRDSWESDNLAATGTVRGRTVFRYSTVQWDLPLSDDLFVFHPSTGSRPVGPPVSLPGYGDPLAKAVPPVNSAGVSGGIGGLSPAGGTVVTTAKVTAPVLVRKVAPSYSREAHAANYQGSVLVSVDVDEDGRASQVRLIRGLGLGLDYQAVEAARQWQFTPGTRDGMPAKMTRPYEVDFRLADGGPWSMAGAEYRPIRPKVSQPTPLTISKPTVRQYVSPAASACTDSPGYVAVHLHIDAEGAPSGVEAVKGPFEALGPAAVAAVQAWTFVPALANRKQIPADATIVLECQVQGSAERNSSIVEAPQRVGGGVTPPVIVFKVEPEYSEEARKAKYQGTVMLHLVVDPEGRPSSLSVMRSVGLGLDEKALDAVAQWRFKPGTKEGKPISVQSTVQVTFKLL